MSERIRTVIIGAGQAGLAVSRHLVAAAEPHVIVERGRLGERWRSERWDSFRLLSPNWYARLPGAEEPTPDPDGFMTARELVRSLEAWAESFGPPVRCGVEVEGVAPSREPGRLLVRCAGRRTIEAANVVVATGPDHRPLIPAVGRLDPDVFQLHSCRYRSPRQLPPGGVLVVGTGPSGQQIAEELYQSGRQVYLSVGRFTMVPRRYRGQDCTWWMDKMGDFDRTVDSLDREARQMPRYALTGNRGGHDLDLRRFAHDGVVLLGRLQSIQGADLHFAPDLGERLEAAETGMEDFKRRVDDYLQRHRLSAPLPDPPTPRPGSWRQDPILALDLKRQGITTVLWATGFRTDLSWIELPIFGDADEPRHIRGVTAQPGLFLIGLRWLYKFQSSFIRGVAEDAAHIAERLLSLAA